VIEPVIEWITKPDGSVWEQRAEVQGEAECPCGAMVELEAETDGHYLGDDGRWHHESFGPATGLCDCGTFIADWWEGCFAFGPDVESDAGEEDDE
jgi:hypothetical protein